MNMAIITGGNCGLVSECARVLAQTHEWRIVVACRYPRQAESTLAHLRQQTEPSVIEAWELDLASLDSINQFADKVCAANLPPL